MSFCMSLSFSFKKRNNHITCLRTTYSSQILRIPAPVQERCALTVVVMLNIYFSKFFLGSRVREWVQRHCGRVEAGGMGFFKVVGLGNSWKFDLRTERNLPSMVFEEEDKYYIFKKIPFSEAILVFIIMFLTTVSHPTDLFAISPPHSSKKEVMNTDDDRFPHTGNSSLPRLAETIEIHAHMYVYVLLHNYPSYYFYTRSLRRSGACAPD